MKKVKSKYSGVKHTYCGPGCYFIHTYPAGQDGIIYRPNPSTNLFWLCACGCGDEHHIPLCLGTKVDGKWLWNGNVDEPTITPSIQLLQGCRWHGFLTCGKWDYCTDGAPNSPNCVAPGKRL